MSASNGSAIHPEVTRQRKGMEEPDDGPTEKGFLHLANGVKLPLSLSMGWETVDSRRRGGQTISFLKRKKDESYFSYCSLEILKIRLGCTGLMLRMDFVRPSVSRFRGLYISFGMKIFDKNGLC